MAHAKRDAGSASLNKRTTPQLRGDVRAILGVLDSWVHQGRLEAQNRRNPKTWEFPDRLEATMANLELHVAELRRRPMWE